MDGVEKEAPPPPPSNAAETRPAAEAAEPDSDDDDRRKRRKRCIPLTTIRAMMGGRRVTRAALRQLQDGVEAYACDVFRTAAALRDLQGQRTLHDTAFRMAVELAQRT